MTYRYLVAGLLVETDRAMSFLGDIYLSGSEDVDVTIATLDFFHSSRPKKAIDDTSLSFCAKEGLIFQIISGQQILVFRDEFITDRDVAIFLLGSAWGVLCHQRGLFPLHCSSVCIDGYAFAFAAQSGGGKSSLAAGLSTHGLAHFCDDVAVISLNQDQGVVAHPMPKGIKLWKDATEALGFDPSTTVTSDHRIKKYYVNTKNISSDSTLKLKCIYVLSFSSDSKAPYIEQLSPDEALMSIYRNVYRVEWLHAIGNAKDVLSQSREIIERIPVVRFTRPRDFNVFGDGMSLLIDDMKCQLEDRKIIEKSASGIKISQN